MRIYTFPGSDKFYKQLSWISNKALSIDPICLHHTDLDLRVDEFDSLQNPRKNYCLNSSAQIAGISEPVVIFSEANQQVISTFIMAFKKNGIWPMLAVITEDSKTFSLAELVEHLTADRKFENQRKAALHKQQNS